MRKQDLIRNTAETKISMELNLDGEGKADIDTGIGFFDHMLQLFAFHGGFDLKIKCVGDLKTGGHHTVEDIGIVLGKLINLILGDKKGIERFSEQSVPMDDALVTAVIDISGRPYLAYNLDVSGELGGFNAELTEEFFRAVCSNALFTLHLRKLDGRNLHHIIEASFKAFARALKKAVKKNDGRLMSTKGVL